MYGKINEGENRRSKLSIIQTNSIRNMVKPLSFTILFISTILVTFWVAVSKYEISEKYRLEMNKYYTSTWLKYLLVCVVCSAFQILAVTSSSVIYFKSSPNFDGAVTLCQLLGNCAVSEVLILFIISTGSKLDYIPSIIYCSSTLYTYTLIFSDTKWFTYTRNNYGNSFLLIVVLFNSAIFLSSYYDGDIQLRQNISILTLIGAISVLVSVFYCLYLMSGGSRSDNSFPSNWDLFYKLVSGIIFIYVTFGLYFSRISEVYFFKSSSGLCVYRIVQSFLIILIAIIQHFKFQHSIATRFAGLNIQKVFVRYISHEICTPLNVVHLGLKLLQKQLKEANSSSPQLKTVEEIMSSCDLTVDILNDLLTNEGLETGALTIKCKNTEIIPFITHSMKPFLIQAENAKIRLNLEISADHRELIQKHVIHIDKKKMCQVLKNLLANSLKNTLTGGHVNILVRTVSEDATATDTSNIIHNIQKHRQQGHMLQLEITHDGVGLTDDGLQKVFNQGQVFDLKNFAESHHDGLGIWLCKGLVELHGGRISVSSRGAEFGKSFIIDLPMRIGRAVVSPEDRSAPPLAIFSFSSNYDDVIPTSRRHSNDETAAQQRVFAWANSQQIQGIRDSIHDSYYSDDDVDSNDDETVSSKRTLVGSTMHHEGSRNRRISYPPITRDPRGRGSSKITPFPLDVIIDDGMINHLRLKSSEGGGGDEKESDTPFPRQHPPIQKRYWRLLFVDDVKLSRKMTKRLLLTKIDTTEELCDEAEDGLEAVAKVRRAQMENKPYDAIFMDYMMPVMDGPTATREIRSLGFRGHVIGITGNSSKEDIFTFMEHGATAVLTKPLDINALEAMLHDLEEKRLKKRKISSPAVLFSNATRRVFGRAEDKEVDETSAPTSRSPFRDLIGQLRGAQKTLPSTVQINDTTIKNNSNNNNGNNSNDSQPRRRSWNGNNPENDFRISKRLSQLGTSMRRRSLHSSDIDPAVMVISDVAGYSNSSTKQLIEKGAIVTPFHEIFSSQKFEVSSLLDTPVSQVPQHMDLSSKHPSFNSLAARRMQLKESKNSNPRDGSKSSVKRRSDQGSVVSHPDEKESKAGDSDVSSVVSQLSVSSIPMVSRSRTNEAAAAAATDRIDSSSSKSRESFPSLSRLSRSMSNSQKGGYDTRNSIRQAPKVLIVGNKLVDLKAHLVTCSICEESSDGIEALTKVMKSMQFKDPHDVLIIHSSIMNAMGTIQEIRAMGFKALIGIIWNSVEGGKDKDGAEFIQYGADRVFSEPLNIPEIIEFIQGAVNRESIVSWQSRSKRGFANQVVRMLAKTSEELDETFSRLSSLPAPDPTSRPPSTASGATSSATDATTQSMARVDSMAKLTGSTVSPRQKPSSVGRSRSGSPMMSSHRVAPASNFDELDRLEFESVDENNNVDNNMRRQNSRTLSWSSFKSESQYISQADY